MAVWNRKAPPTCQPNPAGNHNDNAIDRINNAIAEENSKMNKLYSEIGKKYAESHAADYEEGFSEQMEALAASQKKLSNYSLQMQFVTGIIVCKNCGHKAPKDSVFCNKCGSKLPQLNQDHYEICNHCGSLVEKGQSCCPDCSHPMASRDASEIQCPHCSEFVGKENRFCPNCGKPLPYDNAVPQPQHMTNGKKCSRCGMVMNADVIYCTECGFKLDI